LNVASSGEDNLGKAVTYLTNTLTKLETGSKLTEDKELGIKGFYLSGILIKSRNTDAGTTFKMVFEPKNGVNNLLTNFVNLKDMGRITGAGRSFKLDTCPDVKFSLKEFSTKYHENKELRKAFDEAVKEEYSNFIPDEFEPPVESTTKKKKEKVYTLIDEEEEVYQDEDGKYYIIEDDEYVEVEYE
jgi:hypothetical protein